MRFCYAIIRHLNELNVCFAKCVSRFICALVQCFCCHYRVHVNLPLRVRKALCLTDFYSHFLLKKQPYKPNTIRIEVLYMALKSKALKKASKAASKGSKGNKQIERVIAKTPKATKYGLKAAANTFVPFYSKTAQSFAKQHRDLTNWVRNSSPFKSGQGNVPSGERRITNNAKTVLAAFKTDIKKGHLLDFRNTNAAFNKAIGGITEEGFDDNYDAEMMVNDSFDESSDGDTSNRGPANYDALIDGLLDGDTFTATQQASTSATLESIDNATGTMADVTVGAAEYASNRITASVNIAVSHLAEQQIQTNEILTSINSNIASIVEHNNATADFQSQTLDFFQKTESSLNQLVELAKYTAGKEDERYRGDYEDPYDFLAGGKFDIKKFGANLWKNSQLGQLGQAAIGQLNPLLKLFGIDIADKLVDPMFKKDSIEFNPVKHYFERSPIKRIIDNWNENIMTSAKMFFHRLATGKVQTGNGMFDDILDMLSQTGVFGNARYGRIKGIYSNGYDTKEMAHLTEATVKTIENVIPDYLSGIEGYLRNIYEGIYDGSMASTFEILNPEASAFGRRRKEVSDELYRLKHDGRSPSDTDREKMYSPINNRLDTIIDLLENGVIAGVPFNQTLGNANGFAQPGNQSKSVRVKRVKNRSYAQVSRARFDAAEAEQARRDQEQKAKANDRRRSQIMAVLDDMPGESIRERLAWYKHVMLSHVDEYLIQNYGFTDDQLNDGEIKDLKSKIFRLNTTGKIYGAKNDILSLDDLDEALESTKIVKDYHKAEADDLRAQRDSQNLTRKQRKERKNYYTNRGEFKDTGYAKQQAEEAERERKYQRDQERERQKQIAAYEEELKNLDSRRSSMGSIYQNAINSAANRQEAIKNGTTGNANRIFDAKTAKYKTQDKLVKDYFDEIDAIKSSSYNEVVDIMTKLIGNKETKNGDRLKEISNFINSLPPDFVADDEVMSQFYQLLIKDGDIANSLDLDSAALSEKDVIHLLPSLFRKMVDASEDYSNRVSELNSSINNGESAISNVFRNDISGALKRKATNYYSSSNGEKTNAKWYSFNSGGNSKESLQKQMDEWKSRVEEALKDNHNQNEVDKAREIYDSLIESYMAYQTNRESARGTDNREVLNAAKESLKKYKRQKRVWESNSIGKNIGTFNDGMEADESLLSLFRDTANMNIDDPAGFIGEIASGMNVDVTNPKELNNLFLVRLPMILGFSHDNELYQSWKRSFSGDMTLENAAKGLANFVGIRPKVRDDDDDNTSEGSGWGNHYSQLSYGNKKYGDTTMSKGACGPVALANAFSRLGIQVDPVTMAAISEAMGYAVDGGTSAGLFTDGVKSLGLNGSEIGLNSITKALRSGRQVIISGKSVGGGMYTPAGHIISLNGIHGNKVGVDDPLKSHSTSKSLSDVLKGARRAWSVGSGEGDSTVDNIKEHAGELVNNVKNGVDGATKAVTKFGKEVISGAGMRAKTAFGQAGTDFVAQETVLLSGLLNEAQQIGQNVKNSAEGFFGPNGWISNKIKDAKKEARNKKIFGEKDANGFYKGGLLSAKAANYIKELPQMARHAFFGDGYTSYEHGKIEDSEGFISQSRRKALIKKYGENYRDDPRYQALPDNLKDYEDRAFKPVLKMASSEVGDDGTAKDTYDYGKYRKLPCGGEVRGWRWEDNGWKFLVTMDGKTERMTPSGDWGDMLTDNAVVPSLACTEAVMKQAETSLRNKPEDDGQLLHHRNIPMTKMDGFLSFLNVKNESVLGPNGEAYDTNDYSSVEARVSGLHILGWRYDNQAKIWKLHYSFNAGGKGKEYTFKTALTNKDILPPDNLTEAICKAIISSNGSSKWSDESISAIQSSHYDSILDEMKSEGKYTGSADDRKSLDSRAQITANSFETTDVAWQKDAKNKCWKLVYTKKDGSVSETVFPNYNNLASAPDERATKQAMKFIDNIEADENSNSHKRGLFAKGTKGTKGFKQTTDEKGNLKTKRVASSFYDMIYDANDAVEDIKNKGRRKRWLFGTAGMILGGPTAIIPAMIAGTAIGAFEKTDLGKNTKAFIFGGKDAKGEMQQGLFGGALGKIKDLLMGKSVLGSVVGAIFGGMIGGPAGALAGASVLSHLMSKGSKLRKMVFGGRDENGKWQWPPLMKGIKGVLKFIFSKGHRLGAVAGGVLGASMGPLGILLGSTLGGHVFQPAARKVFKFGSNIRKGSKIKKIAQSYQLGEITEKQAKKALGKVGKVGKVSDDDLAKFLNAGSNVHQNWLDSGETLADFVSGKSKIVDGSETDASDAAKINNATSEGQGPDKKSFSSAILNDIDKRDKLEEESMEANVETPNVVKKIYDLLNSKIHRDEAKLIKDKHDAEEAKQTEHAREGSLKKSDDKVDSASLSDHDEESEDEEKKPSFIQSLLAGAGSLINGIGIKGLAIGAGALCTFSKLKDTKFGKWVGEKLESAFGTIGRWVGDSISKVDWSGVISSVGGALVDVVRGAGHLLGKAVDSATGNKTNFDAYDDNGNYNGTFVSNIAGVTYKTVIDPETGEKRTVSSGPSLTNSTVGNSVTTLAATTAKGLLTNSAVREKAGEMAYKAAANVGKHSFFTGGLKTIGASEGLISKVLSIVRSFIDSIIQGVAYLGIKFSKTGAGQKLASVGNKISSKISNLINSKALQKEIGTNSKFVEAVTKITGGAVIKSTMTAAFVVYGLVAGGAWECNDLFGITEDDLHGNDVKLDVSLMRSISGVFKALIDSNIPGSIFGLVNDLIYTITGTSIKREFATAIYNCIEALKGDAGKEAISALSKAQNAYEKRVKLYNKATGEALSMSEYETSTEIKGFEKFARYLPEWMKTKKFKAKLARRDQIISATNAAEAENIGDQVRAGTFNSDDLYTNMSVESMSADDKSEGYGAPKSVGYGASNSTHYSQLDKSWRNVDFGKMTNGSTTTIGTGGCGPTALANVARNLTGNKNITPSTVASMAQDYGYTANGGSAASLFTEGANRLGLSSRRISLKNVPTSLASGHKLILSGKRKGAGSPYTDAGHIISVNGIKNGKALVDDPLKSTTESISVNKLLSGAKKAWVVDKGNAGYGTTDPQEYLDNLQSMGYGWNLHDDVSTLSINKYQGIDERLLANPTVLGNTGKVAMFYAQYPFSGAHTANKAENLWKNKPIYKYGTDPMLSGNSFEVGCIPTAFANVLSSITGLDIDPLTLTRLYKWNEDGTYGWDHYNDFYKLLEGHEPKHSDPYYMVIDRSGKVGNATGYYQTYTNGQPDAQPLAFAKKIRDVLMNGGGVFVDTHSGSSRLTNSYSTYAGGHGYGLYGYKGSGNSEWDPSDSFYVLDPGRLNKDYSVKSHTFQELLDDLNADESLSGSDAHYNIRNFELYPPAYGDVGERLKAQLDKAQKEWIVNDRDGNAITTWAGVPLRDYNSDGKLFTKAFNFTTGKFEEFNSELNSTTTHSVSNENHTASDITESQSSQKAKDVQDAQSNPWVADQDYLKNVDKWKNDFNYTGPNYDEWSSDDSLTAKISNIMLAIGGIGERFMEKLFGGKYKSVFGNGSSSSNGSTSYNKDNIYVDPTRNARGGFYFVRTPGGKKDYVSIPASQISDNMGDAEISAVIDDIMSQAYSDKDFLQWYYRGGKSKIDMHGSYDESGWTINPSDANDSKMFTKYRSTRKSIRAHLVAAIAKGSSIKEGYFKIPLEIKDKNDKTTTIDFKSSIGNKNTMQNVFEEIRGTYADSKSSLSKNKNFNYYISDDDIWSGIMHSIDHDSDGKFDSYASVYDIDGNKISNYSQFAADSWGSTNVSGSGASATDSINSALDFDVIAPNGQPMEYADTGLDKSMISASKLVAENHADPGYAFAGDTARSKLSNAYGLGNISTDPSRYGAKESISPNDFKQSTLKTAFRDLRKFPPITADKVNQMIDDLAKYQPSSLMKGHGQDFVDASNMSGIDPRMLVTQAGIESAWGTSSLAVNKGNLYGISAFDGSAYESGTDYTENGNVNVRKSIMTAAEWISRNYINNMSGNYDPQCTAAQLGWSDVHIYGSGDPANGKPYRTAYGNGIAATLSKAEGYGDPNMSLMDDNDIDPGFRNFVRTSSSSSSEGWGIGNSSTRNSMSISATRSYSPKTNIDNSNSTRINAPIDVNVDLNNMESCARNMVSLLERIATNTGRKTGGTTNITNNYDGHKEVGYGDITVNQTTKSNKSNITATPSINNNHIDKFRKIHNMVAKSSR